MSVAARCVFSELAEADLTEIALFIAADSPVQALRFVAELRDRCRSPTENPARFRLREEYGAGVRVAVHGRYLIFYAERAGEVVIERVPSRLPAPRLGSALTVAPCPQAPLRPGAFAALNGARSLARVTRRMSHPVHLRFR